MRHLDLFTVAAGLMPTVTTDSMETRDKNYQQGGTPLQMFATLQARYYRTGQEDRYANPGRSYNLNDQLDGQLSTSLCEWMMGYPIGFTSKVVGPKGGGA